MPVACYSDYCPALATVLGPGLFLALVVFESKSIEFNKGCFQDFFFLLFRISIVLERTDLTVCWSNIVHRHIIIFDDLC